MTPERRAVVLVLGLAAAGQGLRLLTGRPGSAPGQVQLFAGGAPGTPRAHKDSSLALARPLAQGERIDLDRATAAEIMRLPRVGLSLARTIVADRESHGPFGSLEGLDRVPGIGLGLLGAIGPHVKFSVARRLGDPAAEWPLRAEGEPAAGESFRAARSGETVVSLAGEGRADPAAEPPSRRAVNLNSAGVVELEKLPFVGPYMAAQIVAYRDRHGPFPAVDSLVRVPGVGPATLAKIRDRVVTE